MKPKTHNGEVRSSEKDFETLQLGAFATPGLLLAQGPVCLTRESGVNVLNPDSLTELGFVESSAAFVIKSHAWG
jgi:hypothetical protein